MSGNGICYSSTDAGIVVTGTRGPNSDVIGFLYAGGGFRPGSKPESPGSNAQKWWNPLGGMLITT